MATLKIKVLSDIRERKKKSGEISYVHTVVNDMSKIMTCFLPSTKQQLFSKGVSYIVKGANSWISADVPCVRVANNTKVIVCIFSCNIVYNYSFMHYLIHYYITVLFQYI